MDFHEFILYEFPDFPDSGESDNNYFREELENSYYVVVYWVNSLKSENFSEISLSIICLVKTSI